MQMLVDYLAEGIIVHPQNGIWSTTRFSLEFPEWKTDALANQATMAGLFFQLILNLFKHFSDFAWK